MVGNMPMRSGRHRFGTKKRIYTVAVVSIATLVLLTSLFFNVLAQQRVLLQEIEVTHFGKMTGLTTLFSELSSNHARLVDMLGPAQARPEPETLDNMSLRFLGNVSRLSSELVQARPRFAGQPGQRESYGRLTGNLKAYQRQASRAIELAATDHGAADRHLRLANRHYRRISQEFEILISGASDGAARSIAAAVEVFDFQRYQFAGGAVLIVVLLAILTVVMLRTVLRDIAGIAGAMSVLTTGRTDVRIPGLERRDEIGEMARATAVFKSNLEQLEVLSDLESKAQKLQSEVAALLRQKSAYEDQVARLNTSALNLTEERDAAAAANRAKSELLSSISYDIRTPMNGLMGMAGLVLDSQLAHEQRDHVEAIRQSGEALLAVVNDLLDYAKLDADQVELEPSEFDLVEMIESIPAVLWPDRARMGVDLLFFIAQDVPQRVVGDSERLAQALVCLLTTAARSSVENDLSLEASVDESEGRNAVLRFDVIAHADAPAPQGADSYVMRNWQQTPAKPGANDLAMAICQRIVALMGGSIGHEAMQGGAVRHWMTVRLGLAEAAADDWRQAAPSLYNRRALVVHGSAAGRDLLGRQLEIWGMKVEHAADGRAALSRMARAGSQQAQYDIVLIDTALPDMSGVAFTRAMRTSTGSDGVRVLLHGPTGETPDPDLLSALKISGYLSRPLLPTSLLDAVAAVLNSRSDEPPVRDPDPDEDRPAVAHETPKLRILLVDDNQMNQKVVAAMLKSTGHVLDIVGNGREGIDAVQNVPYDMVLMDIQMPEMDGVEATREIRALTGEVAGIPIIALTANAMEGDRERYIASGMDDYVSKPINRTALIEAIDRQFRAHDDEPSDKPRGEAEPLAEEAAQPDGVVAGPRASTSSA